MAWWPDGLCSIYIYMHCISGWWFQTWLLFFKMVKTANQISDIHIHIYII
jgi:hypothetical protein